MRGLSIFGAMAVMGLSVMPARSSYRIDLFDELEPRDEPGKQHLPRAVRPEPRELMPAGSIASIVLGQATALLPIHPKPLSKRRARRLRGKAKGAKA